MDVLYGLDVNISLDATSLCSFILLVLRKISSNLQFFRNPRSYFKDRGRKSNDILTSILFKGCISCLVVTFYISKCNSKQFASVAVIDAILWLTTQ